MANNFDNLEDMSLMSDETFDYLFSQFRKNFPKVPEIEDAMLNPVPASPAEEDYDKMFEKLVQFYNPQNNVVPGRLSPNTFDELFPQQATSPDKSKDHMGTLFRELEGWASNMLDTWSSSVQKGSLFYF